VLAEKDLEDLDLMLGPLLTANLSVLGIRMFLVLPDPHLDPLVYRADPATDPSIIK
jgi:hypothetical protein